MTPRLNIKFRLVLQFIRGHCGVGIRGQTAIAGGWLDINWKQVKRRISALQSRIVEAVRQGRWDKVRCLQRLISRSYSARLMLFAR